MVPLQGGRTPAFRQPSPQVRHTIDDGRSPYPSSARARRRHRALEATLSLRSATTAKVLGASVDDDVTIMTVSTRNEGYRPWSPFSSGAIENHHLYGDSTPGQARRSART